MWHVVNAQETPAPGPWTRPLLALLLPLSSASLARTFTFLKPGMPADPLREASAPLPPQAHLHPEGLQLRGTGLDLSIIAIFQPCKAASVSQWVSHLSKDDMLLCPLLASGKCQRKNSSSLCPRCRGAWSQRQPLGCDCPPGVVGGDPQPSPPPGARVPVWLCQCPDLPAAGVRVAGAGRPTASDLGRTLGHPQISGPTDTEASTEHS